jgi:hypothetical protein
VGGAVHGHLPLLHGLEQRRLGLGRRPVHLVGQHEAGEHGAGAEHERPGGGVEHHGTGDVGREQVGGELHARERQAGGHGQGPGGQGLGHPGDVVEQDVPAAEQSEQQQLEHLPLAHHGALHLVEHRAGAARGLGDAQGHRASSGASRWSGSVRGRPLVQRRHQRLAEQAGHRGGVGRRVEGQAVVLQP